MFRVRIYALAMCVRMLLLVQLLAVLTVMAHYLVDLRDYPLPHLDEPILQCVAGCGTLLRLVDSMYWATTWMGSGEYELLAKGVHALGMYETSLIEQLRAMKWS